MSIYYLIAYLFKNHIFRLQNQDFVSNKSYKKSIFYNIFVVFIAI